ncbi:hypothetical protein [Dyella sp.]|uniref:hypothetical protein n=1 Tax=Dyella sp. TaxID=1869338 RepID=UPI002ED447F1
MAHDQSTSLPKGPVLCETCKQAGQQVEMERYDPQAPANREHKHATHDTQLQTYRCPVCEETSLFKID